MKHHQSAQREEASSDRDEHTSDPLVHIQLELVSIKENLIKKDFEIDELNEMLKNAHITINRLNDRITTLEEQISQKSTPNAFHPSVEKTLLIGDENLTNVRLSDLGTDCSEKTLKERHNLCRQLPS